MAVPPCCSFVGHLAGIVAGCLVHFLRLDRWLPASLSLGLLAAVLVHAAVTCPWIHVTWPSGLPALARRCRRQLGSRAGATLVGGRILRGDSAAEPAGCVAPQGAPRKLGGVSSGVRRIGGMTLPLGQGQRGTIPAQHAKAAAAAQSAPRSPRSYRILRFSAESPPSA